MTRRKAALPGDYLDARLALAFVAGVAIIADMLRGAGVGADHPAVRQAANRLVDDLKRQYDRKVRAQALRRRSDWRKADGESLVSLFLLPGRARPAAQRAIARLLLADDKVGRGVVPARSCEEALREGLESWSRMVDPATSAAERKKSPWYPRMIEAAYRGELARVRRKNAINKDEPHLKASEHAEHNVAEAAGITPSEVHHLCQQVRDDFARAKRLAAARPGHGVEPDPPVTAADLKRHLDDVARALIGVG